jgi:hypothetical protein
MSEYQFWHGDMRLLSVYQKAYLRDRAEKIYMQANYQSVAMEIAVGNALATKKSNKHSFGEIVKYKDPIEKIADKQEKITKENLETKFRQDMMKQQNWLRNILKK